MPQLHLQLLYLPPRRIKTAAKKKDLPNRSKLLSSESAENSSHPPTARYFAVLASSQVSDINTSVFFKQSLDERATHRVKMKQ
mmetsp:Transcript_46147/g.111863  ORF Transcript_46147/g.111863 Transcript_46147/m.111863 type:complete len:83 (+) Transcript_46147:431-679(+)